MIRALLLLASLALPAGAEPARVISGEHDSFTRLVIELPAPSDWTVGRTAMGYGFASATPDQPNYDLGSVWQRIPRDRLQALRTDPDSGALLLTLGCACHVFPFEAQPGTVVLDIRDGPAPAGSAFEAAFSERGAPTPTGKPPLVAAGPTYAWLDADQALPGWKPSHGLILPFVPETPSLDPLRDALLLQISRGAADGAVDMTLPGKPEQPDIETMGDLSGALIRIGEVPGLTVDARMSDGDDAPDNGQACLPDETLALSGWGDGRPPLDLLAEARGGLYGEFDALSPEVLRRTIRLHLYLGFGAEALQYAALQPDFANDPDLAPLLSMARLIEGDSDPSSPFSTMLGCDGSAALWAALAQSDLPASADINADAIVRSFQSLPPHLRRHLGARLAALLQERDAEAVRIIRNAMERTADVPAGTVALIDAESDLHAERPDAARNHAETAVKDSGGGLQALIALVEAHFQSGQPLAPDVAEALLSHRDLAEEDAARHGRALVLALALAGRVDEAFALSASETQDRRDLWQVVATLAGDDPFLSRAVVAGGMQAPTVDRDVALRISARLLALGFPDSALTWLGQPGPADPPERRLIAAKAELARGNARQALGLLSGLAGPDALTIEAAAHQQLGTYPAAREALGRAGQAGDIARLAAWEANWPVVKTEGSPAWAEVATLVQAALPATAGPLAESRAALEESAAARLSIGTLLAEVPTPDPKPR